MTFTIEILQEEEAALTAKAARQGQSLEEYLRDIIKREAQSERQIVLEARLAALDTIGSYNTRAGLAPSPSSDVAEIYHEHEAALL